MSIESKTIRISKKNYELIGSKYGKYGDSFDDAINRLISELIQTKKSLNEIQRENAIKILKNQEE